MLFKDISGSLAAFCWTICVILVMGIMKNNSVKLSWIWPVVQEMSFKRFKSSVSQIYFEIASIPTFVVQFFIFYYSSYLLYRTD